MTNDWIFHNLDMTQLIGLFQACVMVSSAALLWIAVVLTVICSRMSK